MLKNVSPVKIRIMQHLLKINVVLFLLLYMLQSMLLEPNLSSDDFERIEKMLSIVEAIIKATEPGK